MRIQPNNPRYGAKDAAKAAKANKFIGYGTQGSSTELYRSQVGEVANVGKYTKDDIVFISVNGDRPNRVKPMWGEINRAIAARVTFITDDAPNRARAFNVGEREVADHLQANGYQEVGPGEWKATQ
jgi:hypothetical protein